MNSCRMTALAAVLVALGVLLPIETPAGGAAPTPSGLNPEWVNATRAAAAAQAAAYAARLKADRLAQLASDDASLSTAATSANSDAARANQNAETIKQELATIRKYAPSISVIGDGAAKTGDAQAASAGIGLSVQNTNYWFQGLIKAGASTQLNSTDPHDFWKLALAPEGGPASITLDGALLQYIGQERSEGSGWAFGPRAQLTGSKVDWTSGNSTAKDVALFAWRAGYWFEYDFGRAFNVDPSNDLRVDWTIFFRAEASAIRLTLYRPTLAGIPAISKA